MASVGYLVAAAAITLGGLLAYGALLAQRLSKARARNAQLHQPSGVSRQLSGDE